MAAIALPLRSRKRRIRAEPVPFPMGIVDILLCLLLPPLAVFLRKGAGRDFVINLVLWIVLVWIGGVIHAFWVLGKKA